MSRYIDAELLIDSLEEKMRTAEEPYQLADGEKNFNFGLEVATEIAFNMPTADVVEVRHGYWDTRETAHEWIEDFCSVCGHKKSFLMSFQYCPNCGAKMDAKG